MPIFFKKLEKIKVVYDWTYKIMLFICKVLLIGDIIITSITVAGRYIPFFTAPHWGEEIVLTLMVYMAVLSATLAIRRRSHIRMTAFDKYLPKKLLLSLDLLADIAVLALGVVQVGGAYPVKKGAVFGGIHDIAVEQVFGLYAELFNVLCGYFVADDGAGLKAPEDQLYPVDGHLLVYGNVEAACVQHAEEGVDHVGVFLHVDHHRLAVKAALCKSRACAAGSGAKLRKTYTVCVVGEGGLFRHFAYRFFQVFQ